MTTDFNVMVGGEAGQGVQSVGAILSKTLSRGGLYIFADQDYESRVRGGHNFFRIRACNEEVLSASEELDVLVALNEETIQLHGPEVKENGLIIYDGKQKESEIQEDRYLHVPLARLAEDAASNKLMSNTVAVGAVLGLTGYSLELAEVVIKKEFSHLGEDIVQGNISAAVAGFEFIVKKGKTIFSDMVRPVSGAPERIILNGNEAIALGALAAGCKFISGYPMTPATLIMEYFADKGRDYDAVAVHVEDEISAINMAIGAAFSGVRAMTATSGGGFSLMVEGLSLAGMTETPVVIVLGQRPGPATGLPTRTEQGELLYALYAGHGEFPRAVLAPSTVENAFHSAIKAFNLAEKFQMPVIILTDHHIATSYTTVEKFDLKNVKIDRGSLLSKAESDKITDYKRHIVTDSGISPRLYPMQGKALVVTDSDEHDENGHMIEDAETRNEQNLKRLRKIDGIKKEINSPEVSLPEDTAVTLIGWGSTGGAIKEAASLLSNRGIITGTIQFNELYPFPKDEISRVLDKTSKYIVVESNATGQLSRLIRSETGIETGESVLRFDGRPVSAGYIIERFKGIVF
ncbi:2-oxoacid:acceptor oxidoreductase subunit alpha [Chloroflexota bacterium]